MGCKNTCELCSGTIDYLKTKIDFSKSIDNILILVVVHASLYCYLLYLCLANYYLGGGIMRVSLYYVEEVDLLMLILPVIIMYVIAI